MKPVLTSIVLFLTFSSPLQAKPRLPEEKKACPILVLGSADGKTQDLPTRSADTSFDPYRRAFMRIIVRADIIREDSIARGEIEKQKDIPINAYPFMSMKVNAVCDTEVTVKYFMKGEEGKDYYLRITGNNNKIYKEFTKRLNAKTEDSEIFSFKVVEP